MPTANASDNICNNEEQVTEFFSSDDDKCGFTPLHKACMDNKCDDVAELLKNEAVDINATDKNGWTPLHYACQFRNERIVRLLIDKGADCCKIDNVKRTPLYIACLRGHHQIVNMILSSCSEEDKKQKMLDAIDSIGYTPLHVACEEEHTEIIKVLLQNGANPCISSQEDPLYSRLMNASKDDDIGISVCDGPDGANINNKSKEMIESLRQNEPDNHYSLSCRINGKSTSQRISSRFFVGFTPLHVAAKKGLEVLLERSNHHIDQTDTYKRTALHLACQVDNKEIIELLIKKGADCCKISNKGTPLYIACLHGHHEAVNTILSLCFEEDKKQKMLNAIDCKGYTPLHIACEQGHTEIVRVILKHGIKHHDSHSQIESDLNPIGYIPLHVICSKGYTEIVKLLLEHGVASDVNSMDIDFQITPLGIACMNGHKDLVDLLLKQNGVDVNKRNKADQTALHLACEKGCEQVVELLLKHVKVNINVTDKDQHTALHLACEKGHDKVVELLLEHKANINCIDQNEYTALHIACVKGHTKIIKLLLDHEADVKKCDKEGLNPLEVAVKKGQKNAAMAIVNSAKWQNALRKYTGGDNRDKSTGISCCCNYRKTDQFTTPMRRIIKKMPDVAKVVFDLCCKSEAPQYHPDHEITFNYEFLDDFDKLGSRFSNWPPPAKFYSIENHCLTILAKSPRKDLLKHRLAATLLDQKWNRYGWIVYYVNFIFYFLFVLLLTFYALTVHRPNSKICIEVSENENEIFTEESGNETGLFIDCFSGTKLSPRYYPIVGLCLLVYSGFMIIREVFQLFWFRKQYLLSFVNYFEVPLFIFTIIFASVRSDQCYCTRPWQWQFGVIAVFLSWMGLVFSIRKIPVVGIYVVMFITICENFIKVLILALLLILAFAVPFYMMFYDPQKEKRTPFITPWRTTLKTIIMTVGEYEVDSLLLQNSEMHLSDDDVQYPVVTFSLLIVFVVLMPILFLNLLISLAVDDTQEIKKSADTHRLTLRVEFTLPIEDFLRWLINFFAKERSWLPTKAKKLQKF
ncbi:PREDICTED: transient receptor potential cation channel subfamily A member 1 homolog [Amphimedon queenslandica]|uniref:Ion transport domain-containing protein n=2 Tax=Amphimedon queenslandica TaxID=400682 RepID=A0AAN0JSU5_AMPQE|nr:PREDICTED: transient receptor potential cation channel subfamily A member 1 homolog [Amphimedon queenslandica]|eukprot:XP_019859938.1 PREDICTED: transient receptor potential cation channel subfamily A member 1 homolog [Amphimedon queenslandica]